MVNVFEAQIDAVANDQYCDKANVSIRLDKMMDFYRVYLMISHYNPDLSPRPV